MNATNAKALNSMKQKIKRAIKEYENEIKEYQAVRDSRLMHWARIKPAQDPEAFERKFTAIVQPEAAAPKPKRSKKPVGGGSDDEADAVDDQFTTVGKGGKSMQFTPDAIFKMLQSVQEARGKKVSISRQDCVEI